MRNLQKLAATAGLVTIGVFGLQAAAGAQSSGYPGSLTPGTSSQTVSIATTTSTNGTTTSTTACGFAPGSTTTAGVADSTGCVTLTIVGFDPSISINGGPRTTAVFGLNSDVLTVTGVNPTGGVQTDIVNVILTAPAASGIAFTGADILGMVVGGLALIAVGFVIVTLARRRTVASVA